MIRAKGDALPSENTLDMGFDRMAKEFDQWLPFFEPSTDSLIAHASVSAGESILDIACGTGEPGLTLAERNPGISLLGIDAAEPMVNIARAKAAARGLANARFEVMKSPDLTVADESE